MSINLERFSTADAEARRYCRAVRLLRGQIRQSLPVTDLTGQKHWRV